MSMLRSATLAVLIGSAVVPWASGQTFTLIEPSVPVPGAYTFGRGVSYDGRVMAGQGSSGAFLWTLDGGQRELRNDPNTPPVTVAFGVSGNGSTVVGTGRATTNSQFIAYRWRGDGTFQSLGLVGPYRASYALDANLDGSVIVGRVQDTQGFGAEAFRWTETGGMQRLGHSRPNARYSEARAVSADGNIVVGATDYFSGNAAFVWTAETGMRELPGLPNSLASGAAGMNSSGSIIVGTSGSGSEAAIWRNGEIESLGYYQNSQTSARYVSDDGSIVAGSAHVLSLPGSFRAVVWTRDAGWSLLEDYLAMNQIAIPNGWWLADCTGISQDGRTFVGEARTFDGDYRAFHVTIPSPGTLAVLGGAVLGARRTREGKVPNRLPTTA